MTVKLAETEGGWTTSQVTVKVIKPSQPSSQTYNDKKKQRTIKILTKGGHQLLLDDASGEIRITTKEGHELHLDAQNNKISVHSFGDLEVQSATDLKFSTGGNSDIGANGNFTIKGALINLNPPLPETSFNKEKHL